MAPTMRLRVRAVRRERSEKCGTAATAMAMLAAIQTKTGSANGQESVASRTSEPTN